MTSEQSYADAQPKIPQLLALLFKDATHKPTEDHEEGPYYRCGAPPLADLYPADSRGRILHFHGLVTDPNGAPLPGVKGELWQADELGRYDNDDAQHPPAPTFFRCRASFTVAADGTFVLRTVLPGNYSVCDPLAAPWRRVKHLHFKFCPHGFQSLTTEVALLPDQYTAYDPLFRRSLAAELVNIGEENGRAAFKTHFHFVLRAVSSRGYVIAAARTRLLNQCDEVRGLAATIASETRRRRHIVRQADVAIEVIAEGAGLPIVMLPSTGRDSEDFDDVAAAIAAAGFRVLRPQPRGVGCSVGPMQGLTLHDFARDIAAVIENEAAGPAILVGHAFGNWIARMTAVDHPHLVKGVVLAAAAAKTIPAELRGVVGKCADSARPDAERLRYLQFAFFARGHDPSSWLTGWHAQTMDSQGQAGAATRPEEWWSGGTAPMLDLQSGQDPWRPQDTRNELKNEFADRVSVVVIPDASHALIPEQPTAVASEIVGWAQRL